LSYKVVFSPKAQDDLFELYDYIAEHGGRTIAISYIDRLEDFCLHFADFPERGTRRDDIRPGLRVIGFERRVAIAFHIEPSAVIIDRLFYGGCDWNAALLDPN
jgi:toxin ParE1/3/4